MPSRAASMVSPADEETIETMRNFGYQVGMAFQIVDDILDFNGEQATVGKPLGSDLLNGMVTLPAIYYAELNPQDLDVLSLSNGGWTNHDKMAPLVKSIRPSHLNKKAMLEAGQNIEPRLICLQMF